MGVTDMGLRVPEDLSVIGFDDQRIPENGYTGPRITGICQPLYEMGLGSIQTITDILEGKVSQPITRIFDTQMVEYATVCPPHEII